MMKSLVKLPKNTIPIFSGKYTEWWSFRGLSSSLLHKSSDDVQRLHYRRTLQSGGAEQLKRHVHITQNNYAKCREILEHSAYIPRTTTVRTMSRACGGSSSSVKDLKDKVIVVTGGSDGIGLEMADRYLNEGAKIAFLLDIDEKLGHKAVKNLNAKYGEDKAVFYKCDVRTDLEVVTKKIFPCYQVDVLVNNAGVLGDIDIKRLIDTNVRATLEFGRTFWEHMRKDKGGNGGTIINLSSIYGFRVDPFMPIYQSSKFALIGFTRSLGHEANFKRSGVRVFAICPGYTVTRMTDNPIIFDMGQTKEFKAFLARQDWQQLDCVGVAAVESFKRAETGTAWLTEGARPVSQVPFN